jgi:histidine triad (HIT) family protein
MQPTIFTKIINREIPASIVYEDDESIAFMDIHPVSKGHLLLISKEPYEWIQDVPDELLSKMFLKVKKLILSMKKGLGCDYVQVSVVGKDVPHFHIHLIPRHFNDGLKGWDTLSYEDGEIEQLADKIRN